MIVLGAPLVIIMMVRCHVRIASARQRRVKSDSARSQERVNLENQGMAVTQPIGYAAPGLTTPVKRPLPIRSLGERAFKRPIRSLRSLSGIISCQGFHRDRTGATAKRA